MEIKGKMEMLSAMNDDLCSMLPHALNSIVYDAETRALDKLAEQLRAIEGRVDLKGNIVKVSAES